MRFAIVLAIVLPALTVDAQHALGSDSQAANVCEGPEPDSSAERIDETIGAWNVIGDEPLECAGAVDAAPLGAAEPKRSHWFGAVDLTKLYAGYNNGSFVIDDQNAEVDPRIIVGWESAGGLGLRSRFWSFEDQFVPTSLFQAGSGNSPPPFYYFYDVDLTARRFDFDVYRRFVFEKGSVLAGASVAAAELDLDVDVADFSPYIYDKDFRAEHSGGGGGFLLEAQHAFYRSEVSQWSVITRGRWSGVVGELAHSELTEPLSRGSRLSILEAALGLEYKRTFHGIDFVLQYYLEGQNWDVSGLGESHSTMPTDGKFDFLGSMFSLGFAR
jgi:hypothetical protein